MYIKLFITGFLFLFNLLFVYLVHTEGSSFYKNRINKGKTSPKVYDIAAKYLPNLSHIQWLEYFAHFIVLVLPFLFGSNVRNEYFSYIPIIFFIRCFFLFITILPKEKHCDDSELTISNFVFGHCYDKIFSGHFSMITLIMLILLKFKQINILTFGFATISYGLLILMLRFHYTIDLVVAFVITILIYQNKINIDRII